MEGKLLSVGAATFLAGCGLVAMLCGCALLYIGLESDGLVLFGAPGLVLGGGGALCMLPLIHELRTR